MPEYIVYHKRYTSNRSKLYITCTTSAYIFKYPNMYYFILDKTPNRTIVPVQAYEVMRVRETEITTSPPIELEHKKHPGYMPMAALPHKQLFNKPSAYANLSDK